MDPSPPFSIALTPLPPLAELAGTWASLEPRADASFFTSWSWIGPWLETAVAHGLGADLRLLTVRSADGVAALGIAGRGPRTWLSFGRRPLFLHQTGRPKCDSIYVEYNDLLVRTDMPTARAAGLSHLAGIAPLRINAASDRLLNGIAHAVHRVVRAEACACADLSRIESNAAAPQQTLDAFLDGLGRNRRQQIRRAIRLAENEGPLHVSRASGEAETARFSDELVALHGAAWLTRKGKPGAFAEPFAANFIASLISTGVQAGTVDLLRITAGENTIGILLNFVFRGEVYAYQSGFAFTDDNRFKPGLVSHALAIAHYKGRGCKGYHFMAGPNRYKEALSNASETLSWVEIGPRDPFARAAEIARGVRDGLQALR